MKETEFYNLLSGDTDLNEFLAGRIFPDWPTKESRLPYLYYSIGDVEPTQSLSGAVDSASRVEFRLDIWSTDAGVLNQICARLKTLLHYHQDEDFQGIFLQDRIAIEDPDNLAFHNQ